MTRYFDKTEKGHSEIAQGRRNLRGKLRTLLFLIDPGKSLEQIRQQAAQIDAPPDALEQLIAEGYVVELGGAAGAGAPAIAPASAGAAPAEAASAPIGEVERFRTAKAFMNNTIVDALGIRAFFLTLRLERCATRADLKALLPEYSSSLAKKLEAADANALIARTQELLDVT